jgi:lipopolysaccharide/colanic/teichoic acid biosynthesis glycosyltransferase
MRVDLHRDCRPDGMATSLSAHARRLLDALLALLLLVGLSPVIAAVALAVRARMGRPVFYKEWRIGRCGVPFVLTKFRTMTEALDSDNRFLPDADRLTPLGRLLRRTSLDELPELWNVVRGQMSLVGPRPLPLRYLPRYTAAQARRHTVRPGITGLAQVRGRNALTWEKRFEQDVWYVDHQGFLLDLQILCATVRVVVRGDGVSQPGRATMDEFLGSV